LTRHCPRLRQHPDCDRRQPRSTGAANDGRSRQAHDRDDTARGFTRRARDAHSAGEIVIETKDVVFDAEQRPPIAAIAFGGYVSISVVDNGPGMPPEILNRVFEPFFTTKKVGSGLGLSQVYGFVKQSGGYVHVASECDLGTQVPLYLPRSGGRVPGAAKASPIEELLRLISQLLRHRARPRLAAGTPSRELR
jgi:hypothetical protein